MSDRFVYIEGDLTVDAFGADYDLVLLSNIIHMLSPEESQQLFHKCFAAIQPGGTMIIKDFLIDPDRTGPPFSLMFALQMLVHTPAGDTYTVDDIRQWTAAAGFSEGRILDLTQNSRLWIAEKPKD